MLRVDNFDSQHWGNHPTYVMMGGGFTTRRFCGDHEKATLKCIFEHAREDEMLSFHCLKCSKSSNPMGAPNVLRIDYNDDVHRNEVPASQQCAPSRNYTSFGDPEIANLRCNDVTVEKYTCRARAEDLVNNAARTVQQALWQVYHEFAGRSPNCDCFCSRGQNRYAEDYHPFH